MMRHEFLKTYLLDREKISTLSRDFTLLAIMILCLLSTRLIIPM